MGIMRWKNVWLGGAFIGVFSLGAMFSPIGEPIATTGEQNMVKNGAFVQTATVNDTVQQGVNNDTCPISGAAMGNWGGMGHYFSESVNTVIADALGMTVDELQTARYEGKSVAELANEKGVNVNELVDKMIESRKTDLEQLVLDGVMTQEQMDAMLENMETTMKTDIERGTFGLMHGHRGGHMGMGQGGRYNNSLGNQLVN